MTSYGWPCHVPRLPSGMNGVTDSRAAASCRMVTFRSRASITAPQLVQATARVCDNARSSHRRAAVAAVEAAHRRAKRRQPRSCGGCAAASSSNSTKRPMNRLGVIVAVVDGAEGRVVPAQVGKEHPILAPVLEGQLALDALVARGGHSGHRQRTAIPVVLVAGRHRIAHSAGAVAARRGSIWRIPAARPTAIHSCRRCTPGATRSSRRRRTRRRCGRRPRKPRPSSVPSVPMRIGELSGGRSADFADGFEIDVVPDDDRAARVARGLHGARPAEADGRAAVRAATGRAPHASGPLPPPGARCCP